MFHCNDGDFLESVGQLNLLIAHGFSIRADNPPNTFKTERKIFLRMIIAIDRTKDQRQLIKANFQIFVP